MNDTAHPYNHTIYDTDDKLPVLASTALAISSDSTSDLGSDIGNQSTDEFEDRGEFLGGNSNVSPERSPLLRHVILHTVSSQLERLRERTSLGRPTALAVSSYLAVGTSTSVVLIFDSKQVLKCCLADRRLTDFGAVSCLSFSATGDRVIAGHARGHIALWDVASARLLVTASDFHLPDCPVLHARFTPFLPLAVVSDASGSVFALSFTGSTSSNCVSRLLFSGARGEALYFDVLNIASVQHCTKRLPFTDCVVVVIVTVASVIVSTFSPSSGSISKLLRVDLSTDDLSLPPASCWCPSLNPIEIDTPIKNNNQQVAKRGDAFSFRLCIGRGPSIKYFLLSGSKKTARLTASILADVTRTSLYLPSDVLWMCWPKPDFQLIMDLDERLHVFSTTSIATPTRLHSIDMSGVGVVYASGAFFKATATGSSVSRAMAAVGEHACYSSLACSNGQLFVLGTNGVHVLTPRALADRVNQLVECGDRQAAVHILLTAHNSPSAARPVWLDDRMVELLIEFSSLPANELRHEDVKAINELLPIFMEKLVTSPDLFSSVASSIQSPDVRLIFVDQLMKYISLQSSASKTIEDLQDSSRNFLPPQVAQLVFDTLSANRNRFEDLSNFLCFIDVTSLDLDRAIRFTLRNNLYTPYIRLYWEALCDWRTPLVTLLDTVAVSQFKAAQYLAESSNKASLSVASNASSSVSPSLSSAVTQTGNDAHAAVATLLDYIDCLLARLYYPSRRQCLTFCENDRLEAFDLLCSRLPSSAVSAEFPVASGPFASSGKDPSTYAYLKALLIASPDRLLSLLSAVLDSASGETGQPTDGPWNSRRQLLVDIIFEILESIGFSVSNGSPRTPVKKDGPSGEFFSSSRSEALENVRLACYTFAVQELTVSAGRPARLFGDGFPQLIRGLFSVYGDPRAEAALFVLFRANLLEGYCSDAELLAMAEQASFYDLAAAVCLRHGWRSRMLRYYFSVPAWLARVFDFLTESLNVDDSNPTNILPTSSSSGDRSSLLDVCCTYAKQLVAADSVRAARFVSDFIWEDDKRRDNFIEQLRQTSPRLLYTLLVKIRRPLEPRLLAERVILAAQIECEHFVPPSSEIGVDHVDSTLKDASLLHSDSADEDDEQIETCVRAVPSAMLHDCLRLCSQKRFKSSLHRGSDRTKTTPLDGSFAEALVLAENGQLNDAILMALKTIKQCLQMTVADPSSAWASHKLDVAVRRMLRVAAKAKSIKSDINPEVPPQLLSELFCALESEASTPRFSSVVGALCSVFGPSAIIEAVLRAPGGSNNSLVDRPQPQLGAIRRLLSTVFSLSDNEITTFSSMEGIYSSELDNAFHQFRVFASRGIRLNMSSLRCCVCKRSPDEDQMLIFGCDHIAHPSCCITLPNITPSTAGSNAGSSAVSRSSSTQSFTNSTTANVPAQPLHQAVLRRQQHQATSENENVVYCPVCAPPTSRNK